NHACDANVAAMNDLFAPVAPAQVVPASPARFTASVTWTAANGDHGSGNLIPITAETKGFWFFEPSNIEVVVKVLDGRSVNGKFWFFIEPLPAEAYTVTVTDTLTGQQRQYSNTQGQTASFSDPSAF